MKPSSGRSGILFTSVCAIAVILLLPGFTRAAEVPSSHFVNPIGEGADPWVVRDEANDRYLWCFSEGNRGIAVHSSESLTSLGTKHVVWRAPAKGAYSREIWAPELHHIEGSWYIYFAASDGKNENHLTYVLKSETDDPLGQYELHGPLATGDGPDRRAPNVWSIDMTVLKRGGELYALWSGWDAPGTDRQFLYIARMKSPTELTGERVLLGRNDDYLWERVEPKLEARGLNEGPQVFKSADRTFVVYSCGASWLPTYKLGVLELVGDDPLNPGHWSKAKEPVFVGTTQTFGVGHSCFVPSSDSSEWWHVYHAKRDTAPGWRRSVFVQPMTVDDSGAPVFGRPVRPGSMMKRPAGEKASVLTLPFKDELRNGVLKGWTYYGHHQFFEAEQNGLHLGRSPRRGINDYRSGEKVMLDGSVPGDVVVEVTIDFQGRNQSRDAGILFRTSGASVGYDAQRGYFAGIIPRTGLIILGRMDGRRWTELARAEVEIDAARPQRLRVETRGELFTVSLDRKVALTHRDNQYGEGGVGLRVVDAHAVFSGFSVRD